MNRINSVKTDSDEFAFRPFDDAGGGVEAGERDDDVAVDFEVNG